EARAVGVVEELLLRAEPHGVELGGEATQRGGCLEVRQVDGEPEAEAEDEEEGDQVLAAEAVALGLAEGGKEVLLTGGGGAGGQHDEHRAVVSGASRSGHPADRADARAEAVADLEGLAGADTRGVLAMLDGELLQRVAAVAGVDEGVLERLTAAHQRGGVLGAEDPAEDRVGAEVERVDRHQATASLVS